MPRFNPKAGDIAIAKNDKLVKIVYITRCEGVRMAAILYLDGSNPQGNGAIDPDSGLCEHGVDTRKVCGSSSNYYDRSTWFTERGLRRAPSGMTEEQARAKAIADAQMDRDDRDYECGDF